MDFFKPDTIAIVGASASPEKIGAAIFSNLINAGFQGRIFPVNPNHKKLHGAKCYSKISDIDQHINLAIVAIPAQYVIDAVYDAVQSKVDNVIVISAGFGEIGSEGLKKERQLQQVVQGSETRLLGPNCLGVIAPKLRLNASFAAHMPEPGHIAFLSQSGAFNTALLDMAAETGLGFSHFVSLGNKIDINEVDFVEEWLDDPDVQVIGMYLEEFDSARKLLRLAQTSDKPIVVLHPGKSEEALRAISSHTGSLADETAVVDAVMDKVNIIQVDNVEQMFNQLRFFDANLNKSYGPRIALVTNAGGPGIIATDLIAESDLQVPKLSQPLQHVLGHKLPKAASVRNPIDLLGDAQADRYEYVLEGLSNSEEVDTIVTVVTPQYMTEVSRTAEEIARIAKNTNKLILPIFLGGKDTHVGREILENKGIVTYKHLNDGLEALAKAIHWQVEEGRSVHSLQPGLFAPMEREVDLVPLPEQEQALEYYQTKRLAGQVGINLPEEIFTNQIDQAKEFAQLIGYPLVAKAATDQIAHKTDKKAVFLNISSSQELEETMYRLQETIYDESGIENPRVLIQQQLSNESGAEVILGVKRSGPADIYDNPRSKGFGHLLLFGHGGIYTEVYLDSASLLTPANHTELERLIDSTKVSKILKGARTGKPLAYEKLVNMLGQLQLLALTYPEISSIDMNPVIVTENNAIAADVKIFVSS